MGGGERVGGHGRGDGGRGRGRVGEGGRKREGERKKELGARNNLVKDFVSKSKPPVSSITCMDVHVHCMCDVCIHCVSCVYMIV